MPHRLGSSGTKLTSEPTRNNFAIFFFWAYQKEKCRNDGLNLFYGVKVTLLMYKASPVRKRHKVYNHSRNEM